MHATDGGAMGADDCRIECVHGIGRAVRAGAKVDNFHRAVSSAEAGTCCGNGPNEEGGKGDEIPRSGIG